MLLGAGIFGGCSEIAKEPPPEEPPPPSAQEIAQQILTDAQLTMPLPARGSRVARVERDTLLRKLQEAKRLHSGAEEGREALRIVERKVEERIRASADAKLWEHAMMYIDAYEIFNPDSTKFRLTRERALQQLRKPIVTVRGLPYVEGRKVALLSFYMPLSHRTESVQLQIGDELYGMKLLGIVGEDRGVDLRYLETGEVVRALLPSAK